MAVDFARIFFLVNLDDKLKVLKVFAEGVLSETPSEPARVGFRLTDVNCSLLNNVRSNDSRHN